MRAGTAAGAAGDLSGLPAVEPTLRIRNPCRISRLSDRFQETRAGMSALKLGQRFLGSGADLPDLVVMAMAYRGRASILTWDFRHFRAVVLRRGHHWSLVVGESELPKP